MSILRWLFLAWTVLLCTCTSLSLTGQQADEATIRRYSQQAQSALAKQDARAAAVALEELARLTPNNAEVFANLGVAYYTLGRYAQAADTFHRALLLDPMIPNVSLLLGLCEAELGHSKEALPILEPAFRRPPNNEMGRTIGLKLMGVYLSLDQHMKTLEVSEELLQRYPDDPEILYHASHLYGDRALQTMMRLVDVAQESPWKRMAFAEALEAGKHYDLAITEYGKVIAANPSMVGVNFRLGRALLLKAPDSEEARDEALKQFQRALVLDPRNAGAEYEVGEIYRRRGQREGALDHFARAVEIDPRFEEPQIALARSLIDLHRPNDALPHLRAAIQLNPANEVSHFLLAGVYKALGDTTKYQQELALYQKYHIRTYADEPAGSTLPPAMITPEVTRQTLDSGVSPQP